MKLSLLAAVAGLVLGTGAAQAQVVNQIGVYVTPIVSRVSNSRRYGDVRIPWAEQYLSDLCGIRHGVV